MTTQNQPVQFHAQPELDQVLIGLGYASRELLGEPGAFSTCEKNGHLDEFLRDRGITPAMLSEARKLQALLLGKISVPETGFVFGNLTGAEQLLMAVTKSDHPGFALLLVVSARPISSGTSAPLTAADVAHMVLTQSRADGNDLLGRVVIAPVTLPPIPVAQAPAVDQCGSETLLLPGESAFDQAFAALDPSQYH